MAKKKPECGHEFQDVYFEVVRRDNSWKDQQTLSLIGTRDEIQAQRRELGKEWGEDPDEIWVVSAGGPIKALKG